MGGGLMHVNAASATDAASRAVAGNSRSRHRSSSNRAAAGHAGAHGKTTVLAALARRTRLMPLSAVNAQPWCDGGRGENSTSRSVADASRDIGLRSKATGPNFATCPTRSTSKELN